jgi:hypothetical protein
VSKNADWEAATALCTPEQYGSTAWRAHYEANPDILTKMLGDLYRVYKSEEAKRAGTANPSGGRRKAHINGNLDELWSIITPRFSVEPFHVAFKELRGERSLRQFADKLGWKSMKLSRMVKGSEGTLKGYYVMNRYDLEEIARVGGVHPAYFVEWRVMLVQDLLAEVCASQPNLSISMLRLLTQ